MGVKSSSKREKLPMNTKKQYFVFISIGLIVLIGLVVFFGIWPSKKAEPRDPITFSESGSYAYMSLGDVIYEADAIVVGEIESTLPSKWNTPDGKLPDGATAETVFRNLYIYTEHIFQVENFLKGEQADSSILIRTFGGQVGQDIMTVGSEESYQLGQTYLFFLFHDPRLANGDDLGPYLIFDQRAYVVTNGKAVSWEDEWDIEELIAYIENSPLSTSAENIPDTLETKEIMQRIKTAYNIEEEALYAFDTSRFSSIFVNDPRYKTNLDKLAFVRENTNNPTLDSAGYLDYELAYYAWWQKQGVIAERGHIKNQSLWLRFISISINDDIATVILDDVPGPTTRELTLVLIDGQWYIAGARGISAYIENSPSSAVSPHIPDTVEVLEVIQAVEAAYDIEAEASYNINTEKFPMVFINDPRYEISPDQLKIFRNINNDQSLRPAGYLDYQTAQYESWSIARGTSPNRELILQFISISIDNGTATVYLYHTHQVMMIYLVQIDGKWYIAGAREI